MTKDEQFQNRLVIARNALDFTQADLAEETGLKPSAISHFETGKRKPSYWNIIKLARALMCSSDYLLGLRDDI